MGPLHSGGPMKNYVLLLAVALVAISPAAVAEERERIDGDARGANLFEHGPERLRHAFEMGRLERTGQRDRLQPSTRLSERRRKERPSLPRTQPPTRPPFGP